MGEIPERLLRDLADTDWVPEWEIDARAAAGSSPDLTKAERIVLVCWSHGLETKETAAVLGLSMETVKRQLKTARYRMRAKNSAEAACEAIRRGLIP